jgi:hypothetical protein
MAIEGAPVGTRVGMPVTTAAPAAPLMDPPSAVARVVAAVVANSALLATRVAMVRVEALAEETTKVARMELLMDATVRRREVATGYSGLPDRASTTAETVTVKALPP